MALRGEPLRNHILAEAKQAFLENGYGRTSMDAVAARSSTSKRTLYAHFATKDVLFEAVVERIQVLFTDRMGSPEDYADDPREAVLLFCGRFAQLLSWESIVRTCRLGIAEAEHLPEAAQNLHTAFFGVAEDRLTEFFAARSPLSADEARRVAARCLDSTATPWLVRALFGMEKLRDDVPDDPPAAVTFDSPDIETALAQLT